MWLPLAILTGVAAASWAHWYVDLEGMADDPAPRALWIWIGLTGLAAGVAVGHASYHVVTDPRRDDSALVRFWEDILLVAVGWCCRVPGVHRTVAPSRMEGPHRGRPCRSVSARVEMSDGGPARR